MVRWLPSHFWFFPSRCLGHLRSPPGLARGPQAADHLLGAQLVVSSPPACAYDLAKMLKSLRSERKSESEDLIAQQKKTKLSHEFNESCLQKHFIWTKILPTLPIEPRACSRIFAGLTCTLSNCSLKKIRPPSSTNEPRWQKSAHFGWGFKLHH